jgi:hypothetical protein
VAERGLPEAQVVTGLMYVQGRRVPKDPQRAVAWLDKAAQQGSAVAMRELGLLYARGEGLQGDDVRSHMWLSMAASVGDERGAAQLPLIEARLVAEQIEESRTLARAWAKEHGLPLE